MVSLMLTKSSALADDITHPATKLVLDFVKSLTSQGFLKSFLIQSVNRSARVANEEQHIKLLLETPAPLLQTQRSANVPGKQQTMT